MLYFIYTEAWGLIILTWSWCCNYLEICDILTLLSLSCVHRVAEQWSLTESTDHSRSTSWHLDTLWHTKTNHHGQQSVCKIVQVFLHIICVCGTNTTFKIIKKTTLQQSRHPPPSHKSLCDHTHNMKAVTLFAGENRRWQVWQGSTISTSHHSSNASVTFVVE